MKPVEERPALECAVGRDAKDQAGRIVVVDVFNRCSEETPVAHTEQATERAVSLRESKGVNDRYSSGRGEFENTAAVVCATCLGSAVKVAVETPGQSACGLHAYVIRVEMRERAFHAGSAHLKSKPRGIARLRSCAIKVPVCILHKTEKTASRWADIQRRKSADDAGAR